MLKIKNNILKKLRTLKEQRGVSLFLITIMIAVLMSFSLSVATIIVGSSKITSNVADSVKAFHCADSGVEYTLCKINPNCRAAAGGAISCQASPGTSFSGNVNDTNYTFTGYAINSDSNCGANTTINSWGKFKTSTRKIQIKY